MAFIQYEPPSYADHVFPEWSAQFGWFLSFSSVSMIPIVALYKLAALTHGTLWEVRFSLSHSALLNLMCAYAHVSVYVSCADPRPLGIPPSCKVEMIMMHKVERMIVTMSNIGEASGQKVAAIWLGSRICWVCPPVVRIILNRKLH